jgi:hypothetical protein
MAHLPPILASAIGNPLSYAVVRSTSPETMIMPTGIRDLDLFVHRALFSIDDVQRNGAE